jgi:hypothetical protein
MKVLLALFGLFVASATAQFQFFDQFFHGGQQQQQQQPQEKQNSPSDSNWYRQNWEAGMSKDYVLVCALVLIIFQLLAVTICALTLWHVFTSRTTVHAHIQQSRRKSSSPMASLYAPVKAASSPAKLLARSNSLEKVFCDRPQSERCISSENRPIDGGADAICISWISCRSGSM